MFIDNGVTDKIRNYRSMDDLIVFLAGNSNLILTFQTEIMSAMARINSGCEVVNLNTLLFDQLFFKKETVSDIDFELLKFYCNNVASKVAFPESQFTANTYETFGKYIALFLLLLSPDSINRFESQSSITMNYMEIEKSLYSRLLDLYVPCETPEKVITEIINSGKSLGAFISMSYNRDLFVQSIQDAKGDRCDGVPSEAVLLFGQISDIYTNDEMKKNAFQKLHYMEITTIPLQDSIDTIEKRYNKYFRDAIIDVGDTTSYLIDNLLLLFNIGHIDSELSRFVYNVKKTFSIDNKILKAFMLDVLEIACKYTDKYKYVIISETIDTLYNKGFDTIALSIRPAIESDENVSFEDMEGVTEAFKKTSVNTHNAQTKIYSAYRKYKTEENKIDSQISKAVQGMKGILIGDVKTEIIEGKKFSAISLLKQLLSTAAIFSFGPIKAVLVLVVRYALKKSTTVSERKKIILELEAELEMVNEKIEDARGDNNKQAKYALMRTRTELNTALQRLKYGIAADERSVNTAKSTINSIRSKL